MTRTASLPMYDFVEVRAATDELWRVLAHYLRAEGVTDVPDALDRTEDVEHAWANPALLFSQSCGYPLTHAFRGRLRVVATPVFEAPDCGAGMYASAIVVRTDAPFREIEDLRGQKAVVNDLASHSGANALFATVGGASFFADVRTSGSHAASLAMVTGGEADVAAIDRVSYTLLARNRPAAAFGSRVLATSHPAPAPPYVTRASATEEEVGRLRRALGSALADDATAAPRRTLLLAGIVHLPETAYETIVAIEREHLRAT